MNTCPSCAAPLDPDGICTSCGSMSRGFFRGLDLGPPQVAAAVARGLDFYRLLELDRDTDIHTIARRYRQLRALFPDDPRHLVQEPARKLELLELAGRVLTDPTLRQAYDQLRPGAQQTTLGVVRCTACSAPFEASSTVCGFCGTARPPEPQPPLAPPDAGPPATDPIDYYALLGLTAEHLRPLPKPMPQLSRFDPRMGQTLQVNPPRPPTPQDVDAAAGKRQQAVLVTKHLSVEEREARLREIELARRILRDERHRPRYDAILSAFGRGLIDRNRLDGLRQLQETVLTEYQDDQGLVPSTDQLSGMLRQARGYLDAGMPREALPLLRKVIAAQPNSVDAQHAFAQALLASDDPLALSNHVLRQVLAGLEVAQAGGRPLEHSDALIALCQGLIAREGQQLAEAEKQLHAATRLAPQLGVPWRALAAIALEQGDNQIAIQHAQRALAANHEDERALLLIAAACLRSRKRDQALQVAVQIAQLRGTDWNAERVLQEIGG